MLGGRSNYIFFFKSQRNNAFIFPKMTQFALRYAPLNVSVWMSSLCIVFLPVKMPMPHLRLILRPGLPKCKSNCTRVAAHYNGGFKIKTPLANCPLPHPTLQSQRVKYLQIGIIFSNCTSQPPSLPSSREERSLTYYCSEEELRDLGPAVVGWLKGQLKGRLPYSQFIFLQPYVHMCVYQELCHLYLDWQDPEFQECLCSTIRIRVS